MKSGRQPLGRAASIRVRLTLWYVALLAVILAALSGLLYVTRPMQATGTQAARPQAPA